MNSAKLNQKLLRWCFLLLAVTLVPGVAHAQKKSGGGSAPAAHAAPAQHSAPASHPSSGGAGHTNTSTAGHTTTTTGSHPTTTTSGHTTTTTTSHPTTTTAGKTTTTTAGAKTTTTTAGAKTTTTTAGAKTTTTTAGAKTTTAAGGTGAAAGKTTTTTTAGAKTTTGAAGGKTSTTAAGGTGAAGGKTSTTAAAGGKAGGATNTKAGGAGAGGNKAAPTKTVTTKSGATARVSSSGHVTQVKTAKGATVNQNARGGRTISSEHVNARGEHVRTVNTGRGRGYVDHRYNRGGHSYMRRSYYDHGRRYGYAYRGYGYRGYCCYYGYVPGYYYSPAYYGWAYNPWAAPVAYSWGWGGAPWYGYYGYYFNPYPVYASAALWMTDYVISQNLQAAYAAQAQANANAAAAANAQAIGDYAGGGQQSADNGGGSPALSPEVKQAIADEVKAELEAEKAAAAAASASGKGAAAPASNQQSASASSDADTTVTDQERPAALDPNYRTFIVSTVLTEQGADGADCSLSPGDVVTRLDDNPDADHKVKVLVSSSQKSDCHSGSQLSMAVDDLQEMHNHFREQLDTGLKTLAENQGKNGIPAGPAPGGRANPDGQVQPDLDVEAQLNDQQKDADAAESEVQQQAGSNQGGN